MMTLRGTHQDGAARKGFRMKRKDNARNALKDTSRRENESRSGCSVDQEDQGMLKD
jgi:hypothetical protein